MVRWDDVMRCDAMRCDAMRCDAMRCKVNSVTIRGEEDERLAKRTDLYCGMVRDGVGMLTFFRQDTQSHSFHRLILCGVCCSILWTFR